MKDSVTILMRDLGDEVISETQMDLPAVPVGLVPTPTRESRLLGKQRKATINSAPPSRDSLSDEAMLSPKAPAAPFPLPIPIPFPLFAGTRILMWKQDPSVAEIGIRKAYLPGAVTTGPRDARIQIAGLPPVSKNAMGDFIGSTPGSEAFDAVHTYAVVRQTLLMYQRALNGSPVPWQWNSPGNTDPLSVFPRAGVTMNAFYDRSNKCLKFFSFVRPGSPPTSPHVFTCRSFDIVAHETGHAVLDGLKPNWLGFGNPPQTGALHESFGDLTAIFLMLSQMDQVEAVIAQTKGNLHDKNFLSDLAEEFGLALGRPNGLRNADNDLKLSDVTTEVHDLSQIFTGAIYDILADIYAFERNTRLQDDAFTLYTAATYLRGLLLRALIAAPASAATFAHIANQMLVIANADGKPVQYRNFIRNRFTLRQVVVSPTPLTEDVGPKDTLEAVAHISAVSLSVLGYAGGGDGKGANEEYALQDRRGCCGTMQHPQYNEDEEEGLVAEIAALKAEMSGKALIFSAGDGEGGERERDGGREDADTHSRHAKNKR